MSLLVVLLSTVDGRTHFPGHFPTSLIQENTLSPIGVNSNRGESMKDWVKVTGGDRVIRVSRGQRIEIDCEAIGSPAPRLQWYKGVRPVTQMMEEDNEIRGFGLAKIVRKFVADCAVPAHQGSYTCTAIAGGETAVSSPTTVIVDGSEGRSECRVGAPRIVLWAQIVMQTMESDVKIPCMAHTASNIQWASRDGQLIANVPGSRFKVLDSGELVISKLRWADMGTYTCIAENELGKDSVSTFLYPMLNED